MNTSFLILDPYKLLLNYNEKLKFNKFHFFGLTKSNEIETHLQSFLVTLPYDSFNNSQVLSWWREMAPISQRNLVIFLYEIGLSQLLKKEGFILNSAFNDMSSLSLSNPCHENFLDILEIFGILKID
jgi:lipopolysaccharide biosynthesis protein